MCAVYGCVITIVYSRDYTDLQSQRKLDHRLVGNKEAMNVSDSQISKKKDKEKETFSKLPQD